MRHLFLTYLLLISLAVCGIGEGDPVVKSFDLTEVDGGSRVYSICSNNQGLLFVGDKSGIVVFDGENWEKIECGFPVTSMAFDGNKTLFFAGREGIGSLTPDEVNNLRYESLNHWVTSESTLRNLRNAKVFYVDGQIIYVVNNLVLINTPEQLRIIESSYTFHYYQKLNDQLYLYSYNDGLFVLENKKLRLISNSKDILRLDVRGIISNDVGLQVICNERGVLQVSESGGEEVHSALHQFVLNNEINGTYQIESDLFGINTYYDGFKLIDQFGTIQQQFAYYNGLSSNTVFASYIDNWDNLWIGTSSGLSVVRMEFPFTVYNTREGLGTGYDAIIYRDKLFLATSQGLYEQVQVDGAEYGYEKVFEGHVWGLKLIGDQLYFGHGSGLYQLNDDGYEKIIPIPCGWNIKALPNSSDKYLTSTPFGLLYLSFDDGKLLNYKLVKGFRYLTQNFEFDQKGNVWAESKQTIYKVVLNETADSAISVQQFDRVEAGNTLKRVVQLDNDVCFVADRGLYRYKNESNLFVADTALAQFGYPDNVIADPLGNIWLFKDGSMKLFSKKEDKYTTVYTGAFSFSDGLYPIQQENIHYINNNNVIIGTENGFIGYNKDSRNRGAYSSVVFRHITLSNRTGKTERIWGEEILLGQSRKISIKKPIDYSNNSIKFNFSAGNSNYDRIRYQTRLDGYDENWSEWSTSNEKEYTNLPPGQYMFTIRAVNKSDEYSYVASCDFEVRPPWYLSLWAQLTYLLLIIGFILVVNLIYRIRTKQILKKKEEDQLRKEQEQLSENLQKEKEIIELKNEKLKSEVIFQSKDLANSTMGLIQKNQFLIELKEELETIKSYSEQNKLVTEDIRRLIRKINSGIDNEENWHVFEDYFDHVHENFIKKMKKRYPTLTSKDLRMCAYIRMNLTSKEIAPLLNITVRGVEISRYRLRKKLGLERDDNLNDFIVKI